MAIVGDVREDGLSDDSLFDDGLSAIDIPGSPHGEPFPDDEGQLNRLDLADSRGSCPAAQPFQVWKVDHSTGNHRFGGMKLFHLVEFPCIVSLT